MSKKRYDYLDYTKGFGILMIMFAHCIQYFKPMWNLNGYVCSFHVPIFFIASGCLSFYTKDKCIVFKVFIKRRSLSLLFPWLIFSIINSVLKLCVLTITHSLTYSDVKNEMIAFFITGNGTVWFLTTLFFVELVFWLIKKSKFLFISTIYIIITMIFLCLPYMLQGLVINPFGSVIVRTISGCGYYGIGFFVASILMRSKSCWNKRIIGIFLIIVGGMLYAGFKCSVGMMGGQFTRFPFSLISSLCTSVGFIVVLYSVEQYKITNRLLKMLKYYGKNSLIAMLIHPNILLCFTYPFGSIIASMDGIKAVFISLVLWIIIVIMEIPFIWIINNKIPWVIGRRNDKKMSG